MARDRRQQSRQMAQRRMQLRTIECDIANLDF